MQTIKVTTAATADGVEFTIEGGKSLASVYRDFFNPGKWAGRFSVFGSCNNCTFVGAVEFVGDVISSHFGQFGLNVEFVNA